MIILDDCYDVCFYDEIDIRNIILNCGDWINLKYKIFYDSFNVVE